MRYPGARPATHASPNQVLDSIHPSAWKRNSAKFAKNNALNGTKFIADSSLIISMGAKQNRAELSVSIHAGEVEEGYMNKTRSRPAIPF
jgi:hypothetical protein